MSEPGFVREETRVEVDGRTLTLVNLAKPMYPDTGTTKAEVLQYYAAIAPVLLPLLRDRPVTRIRWPHGTGEGSFFEKNLPAGAPRWLPRVEVASSGSRGSSASRGSPGSRGDRVVYPFVDTVADLMFLVNLASLELHVPQWRFDRDTATPRRPDRLVIDLDPGKPAGLHECAQVALLVRDRLGDLGLDCRPVTSGNKGLHLYAPLDPDAPGALDSDQVREAARLIAEELQRAHPRLVVATMTKTRRPGKVFLDWSQNTAAKTTLSPYSLRGTLTPYAAAPRTWAEITEGAEDPLGLEQLRFTEVLARVADQGDLFRL